MLDRSSTFDDARDAVARGSGSAALPGPVPRWDVLEVRFEGPSHGNPFVDVELDALSGRGVTRPSPGLLRRNH